MRFSCPIQYFFCCVAGARSFNFFPYIYMVNILLHLNEGRENFAPQKCKMLLQQMVLVTYELSLFK